MTDAYLEDVLHLCYMCVYIHVYIMCVYIFYIYIYIFFFFWTNQTFFFFFFLTNQLVIRLTNNYRPRTQYTYWVPVCL